MFSVQKGSPEGQLSGRLCLVDQGRNFVFAVLKIISFSVLLKLRERSKVRALKHLSLRVSNKCLEMTEIALWSHKHKSGQDTDYE